MANIDSVKLPNGNEYNLQDVVTPRVEASNRNLLDNPWFKVNQRGFTTGTAVVDSFPADRWKVRVATNSPAITVNDNGLSINGVAIVSQIFDNKPFLNGQKVCLSMMLQDGTILSGTGTIPASDPVTNLNIITLTSGTKKILLDYLHSLGHYLVQIYQEGSGGSMAIRAVKLELGSHSTLHLDTEPDYTTELLKCQRYYTRLAYPQYGYIAVVAIVSNHEGVGVLPLPTMMRTTPTLTYSGSFSFVLGDGTQKSVYQMIIHGEAVNSIGVVFSDNSSVGGLTAGQAAFIYAPSTGAYIELDAEL